MQSNTLRTHLFIASIVPTAAVLCIGAVELEQMQELDIRFFLTILLCGAAAVFCAEYALVSFMQRTTSQQVDALLLVCQDYLSGNRGRRPEVPEGSLLAPLALALQKLLDTLSKSVQPATPQANPAQGSAGNRQQPSPLDAQLQKLIREVVPVTRGDLRVRAAIPQGNVGVIAELFNAFIEEVIGLIQWIRYSSVQITSGTRTMLNGSVDLAQTVETQLLRFSQTTRTVETLIEFLESLCRTSQLGLETVQRIGSHAEHYASDASLEKHDFLHQVEIETNHLAQLLGEVVSAAQSNTALAKPLMADLYAVARRIYDSSAGILQTAEQIKSVSALAEQWHDTVIAFQLPVDVEEKIVQASAPLNSVPPSSILPPGKK